MVKQIFKQPPSLTIYLNKRNRNYVKLEDPIIPRSKAELAAASVNGHDGSTLSSCSTLPSLSEVDMSSTHSRQSSSPRKPPKAPTSSSSSRSPQKTPKVLRLPSLPPRSNSKSKSKPNHKNNNNNNLDSLSQHNSSAHSTSSHNTGTNKIVVRSFVEKSEHDGIMKLKELIPTARSVVFIDTFHAKNFRRWQFKKTGLCRLLMPLISMHRVHVQFQTKLIVEVDDVPRDAILKLLGQVEEDPDITSLEMVGSMTNSQDIQTIVFALVGLLSMRDRTWEAIKFGVTCYYDARMMDESSNSNSSSKCMTAMGDESSNTSSLTQEEEPNSENGSTSEEADNNNHETSTSHLSAATTTTTTNNRSQEDEQVMKRCYRILQEASTKYSVPLVNIEAVPVSSYGS